MTLANNMTASAKELKPRANPAVERDWPKAALIMACGNLTFLGSRLFPWSASPPTSTLKVCYRKADMSAVG
jgi:hypothetical protein